MSVSTKKVLSAHNPTCSFTVVCGCFPLQEQSGVLVTEAIWPESLKYLLSDLLHKQCADPCSRVKLPDSSHPIASWKRMTFAQQTEMRGRCPAGQGLEEQWLSTAEVLFQRPLWPGASIPPAAVWYGHPHLAALLQLLKDALRLPCSLLSTLRLTELFTIYKCFSLMLQHFFLCSQGLGLPFVICLN